jgi:hypothetical protein
MRLVGVLARAGEIAPAKRALEDYRARARTLVAAYPSPEVAGR